MKLDVIQEQQEKFQVQRYSSMVQLLNNHEDQPNQLKSNHKLCNEKEHRPLS